MARLDVYLTEHGYAPSRARAKQLIADGRVKLGGRAALKPSEEVRDGAEVEVSEGMDYVGRGALKLLGAFEAFPIDVSGRRCADIGASTGGFTQVLLEKGAAAVYAVDVGHGQLAPALREDSRVINREGVNVRYLPPDFFEEGADFACCDLSFISLTMILPPLAAALPEGAEIVALIKPQFEAGKEALGKGGILRDKKKHIQVLERLTAFFAAKGLSLRGLCPSPVTGGDGNTEYLAYLIKNGEPPRTFDIGHIVGEALSAAKQEKRK